MKKKIIFLALAMTGVGVNCGAITEKDVTKLVDKNINNPFLKLVDKYKLDRDTDETSMRLSVFDFFEKTKDFNKALNKLFNNYKRQRFLTKSAKKFTEPKRHSSRLKTFRRELERIYYSAIVLILGAINSKLVNFKLKKWEPGPATAYEAIKILIGNIEQETHRKTRYLRRWVYTYDDWFDTRKKKKVLDFFKSDDYSIGKAKELFKEAIDDMKDDLFSKTGKVVEDELGMLEKSFKEGHYRTHRRIKYF